MVARDGRAGPPVEHAEAQDAAHKPDCCGLQTGAGAVRCNQLIQPARLHDHGEGPLPDALYQRDACIGCELEQPRQAGEGLNRLRCEPLEAVALHHHALDEGLRLGQEVHVGRDVLADALDGHQCLEDHRVGGRHADLVPDGACAEVGEVGADIHLLERPIGDMPLHQLDHVALEGRQVVDDAGLLDAELKEDAGDEPVVLTRDANEDIEDVLPLRRRKAADQTKVDEDDVACRLNEDVARVQVAVEVAVEDDLFDLLSQDSPFLKSIVATLSQT